MKYNEWASQHWNSIRAFMLGVGQDTPDTVTVPSLAIRERCAHLIYEEAMETIDALGFEHCDTFGMQAKADSRPDMIEVIDGCCDVSVVVTGTLIAFGIPDTPFIKAVDKNNLEKIKTGLTGDHGKFIKHPHHKPPEIGKLLEHYEIASGQSPSCLGDGV